MKTLIGLLALLPLAGCASVAETSPAAADAAAGPTTADLAPRRPLPPEELAIWNDATFRRHFMESYLSETEVEPRVTVIERDAMQEILDLLAADDEEGALELLAEQRGEASSAVFDFTLANLHFQREELDEAAVAYEAAVDKFPKFRRAWRNLGLVHVRRGDWPAAADALTRVISLGGGDGVTYGLLGYAHANLERHVAAESAFRMAVLLEGQTLDWQLGLARSFFKQERFADAVALCNGLLAEHGDRADLWLLQANAFVGLDEPLRAAENFELVDRLGKSTPASLNLLGDIYINTELFDMAVDSYTRAMAAAPQPDADRVLRAAKVLTARGALDQTRRLVDALESGHGAGLSEGQRKDLLKLRAQVAVAEGASDEEARLLEEIVALDPLDGGALILLGQHSQRAGELDKAVFWFERAASIEDSEADAKVRHAQLLVGQGKYAEALPLLRRSQVLKPRDNIQSYLEQVERVAQGR